MLVRERERRKEGKERRKAAAEEREGKEGREAAWCFRKGIGRHW